MSKRSYLRFARSKVVVCYQWFIVACDPLLVKMLYITWSRSCLAETFVIQSRYPFAFPKHSFMVPDRIVFGDGRSFHFLRENITFDMTED